MLQMGKIGKAHGEEFYAFHEEGNEIWWEMNVTMGALVARIAKERKWIISLIISIISIVLFVISLVI